jgi:hypothetical protein
VFWVFVCSILGFLDCVWSLFFFLAVPEVELRAGALPLEPHHQPFFALVILEMGFHFMPTILLFTLPVYLGWHVCITIPSHWLRWRPVNFLPGLALNLHPPDLQVLSGEDYRLEPPYSVLALHSIFLPQPPECRHFRNTPPYPVFCFVLSFRSRKKKKLCSNTCSFFPVLSIIA